jgi:predicted amidohydrolase YtcJ
MGYEKADLILYNSKVITCDDRSPFGDFVAIKGNKVLAVGEKPALDYLVGPDTKKIDCQGNTVIPGFNDAHCHPISYAIMRTQIDCSPVAVGSIEEIKAVIRKKAKALPPPTWLKGSMYNETHLKEKRHPTRHDLDEGAPDQPVILINYTGASCVLNTEALRLVGITREMAATYEGIETDPITGEPNGLICGMNDMIRKKIPPIGQEELRAGFHLASIDYLSNGITSLQDTTWNNGLVHWNTYHSLKNAPGLFPCRMSMFLGFDSIDTAQNAGLKMGCDDFFLRLGGVKIALDESTMCDRPPREELEAVTLKTIGLGHRAAFHVSNLYQLETSISALQSALQKYPNNKFQHRFEHCMLFTPEHLDALKKLPVMIVTQPTIMYYQGADFMETVPFKSQKYIMPLDTFTTAGIKVALSSDSPLMPINPFLGIYEAVTRKELLGNIIAPEEAISIEKALKMYTLSGAYASGEEMIKGSITPGKLADLLVLDNDISQCCPAMIKETSVMMTILDGKVVLRK